MHSLGGSIGEFAGLLIRVGGSMHDVFIKIIGIILVCSILGDRFLPENES